LHPGNDHRDAGNFGTGAPDDGGKIFCGLPGRDTAQAVISPERNHQLRRAGPSTQSTRRNPPAVVSPLTPDWKRALAMVAGLGAAFGSLLAVAHGLVWAARRFVRPKWPYLVRQGISNLHRPQNQTLLFLLSLGLGTFLLLTILLTRNLLTQNLAVARFPESPNIYLIDVQPDQVEAVSWRSPKFAPSA
jgi:hypothetical protein